MKLTKTLLAAVALATFALPMTATAQVGSNDVIGSINSVNGAVYIERAGQILRVMNDSAVIAGDRIVAEKGGSAMVNLNGCNGKFTPCNQFVSGGNMVSLTSGNYCNDLAALLPMGPNDAVLTAANNAVTGGGYSGPSIGNALSSRALLAILGTGAAVWGISEILSDDDEDPVVVVPTSP